MFSIWAGNGTSGLEYTAVLNTANGQTVGLDVEHGYVDGVAAAAAAATSSEVVWTQTDAHIASVICTTLSEVNHICVISCW